MSVIIHGLDMPKSCDECRLFNECWCMALGIENWRKSYNKPPEGERLPDCSLVPLPEGHGRLIDADRLFEVMGQDADRWIVDEVSMIETDDVLDAIQNAPTVVPAEGGGEDGA